MELKETLEKRKERLEQNQKDILSDIKGGINLTPDRIIHDAGRLKKIGIQISEIELMLWQ